MRPLSPGRKDQRIAIRARAAGVDALGQESTTWQTLAMVWAEAQPIRGREYFAAGQAQSQVDVRFRINFRADVQPTHQVLWRTQPYDIVSVIDVDGKRQHLELMCSQGARDGR